MIINTVMWLASTAALFAWVFKVTLKNTFKTNAKYFGIFIVVHLALNIGAMVLSKHGVVLVKHHASAMTVAAMTILLKSYMVLMAIMALSFFIALAGKGAEKMTQFHTTHNAANLHRNPLKFYLRNQSGIVNVYRGFFLIGGVYMLWAMWFRMSF